MENENRKVTDSCLNLDVIAIIETVRTLYLDIESIASPGRDKNHNEYTRYHQLLNLMCYLSVDFLHHPWLVAAGAECPSLKADYL